MKGRGREQDKEMWRGRAEENGGERDRRRLVLEP